VPAPKVSAAEAAASAVKFTAMSASFASHIEPARETDGTMSLGSFIGNFLAWVKALAADKIDTEEERDAIVDVAMVAADRIVGPRLFGWIMWRPMIREVLDQGIDYLPGLLA
jgi:hypothetical protein